jgi:UDPglucose--hexose-1-phosphate uridylyltransferase
LPELRKDPITGRWVIISTDRGKRPMDFVRESVHIKGSPAICPFCPGNEGKTPAAAKTLRDGRSGWFPTNFRRWGSKEDWTAREKDSSIA